MWGRVRDRLPKGLVEGYLDMVEHGEPGVAFEGRCDSLYEHDVVIAPERYERLTVLGTSMGYEPKRWEILTVAPPRT